MYAREPRGSISSGTGLAGGRAERCERPSGGGALREAERGRSESLREAERGNAGDGAAPFCPRSGARATKLRLCGKKTRRTSARGVLDGGDRRRLPSWADPKARQTHETCGKVEVWLQVERRGSATVRPNPSRQVKIRIKKGARLRPQSETGPMPPWRGPRERRPLLAKRSANPPCKGDYPAKPSSTRRWARSSAAAVAS